MYLPENFTYSPYQACPEKLPYMSKFKIDLNACVVNWIVLKIQHNYFNTKEEEFILNIVVIPLWDNKKFQQRQI